MHLPTFGKLLAVATTLLLLPAQADGFSIHGFRAVDSGSRIHWLVTVCGAENRAVAFEAVLEKNIQYTRDFHGVQAHDCSRWNLSTRDIWAEGVWYTAMDVIVGGTIKTTPTRALYIS